MVEPVLAARRRFLVVAHQGHSNTVNTFLVASNLSKVRPVQFLAGPLPRFPTGLVDGTS